MPKGKIIMPDKQSYSTKARKYILDFLEARGEKAVSAADIINHLNEKNAGVNPATVYRCLNRLSAEHRVLKITEEKTQKSVYRLIGNNRNCNEHIHIKCTRCGKVMHLECEFMKEIKEHLLKSHGFALRCEGSVLYGLCRDCAQK